MSSTVIYGDEFDRYLEQGLAPEQFAYRFLVEGDSWMDRSSATSASLPVYLADAMSAGGDDVLIINLAMFGDTMRRIGECLNDRFFQWITTAFNWKFDAILLSAGGNDFIDAAREPDPGQGILKNMLGLPPPASQVDCIHLDALTRLVTQYLDPNFTKLYDTVQASRHVDVPIFLNNYDTPTARNAPAFRGGRAWLFEAYTKNHIPEALWAGLTARIFDDLQTTIAGWAQGRPSLQVVPTDGVLARADTAGNNGDWLNEIHPNKVGWRKLATVWRDTIKGVI